MTAPRQAIILAAGRGTRLGGLTKDVPKPLLDLAGVPALGRVLAGFAGAGVERAIVVVGYRGEQIEAAIGDGRRFGLSVAYRRQERLDGTGPALALARDALEDDRFAFGWADTILHPSNYGRVLQAPGAGVIAVNEVDDPFAGAAVFLDAAHRVTRIVEKPRRGTSRTRWNNTGFGVLSTPIWDCIARLEPSDRGERELPRAIAAWVEAGGDVRAVPVDGDCYDIGTPEALEAARRRILDW